MKLLIGGKGGAGKSAVSLLLAKELSKKGNTILLDSDESNRLLPKTLGLETPDTIANYLGGRAKVHQGIADHEKINLNELPPEYVSKTDEGITYAAVGKIEEYGEGCACPYGFLSKELLKRIELTTDEYLIVDAEAGIEHLGRGVEEGIDKLIVVIDPTAEGVEIAKKLVSEAERIGKPIHLILNKVTPEVESVMLEKLESEGLRADALIRYDHEIFKSSLMGGLFNSREASEDISSFIEANL
jgi:CO dehydrogenase maturation factor